MHCPRMTEKGQVTIPIDIRTMLHLSKGDQLKFTVDGDNVNISKLRKPTFEDLYNCLPKSKVSFTIEELNEFRGRPWKQ